jgi:hypothetical protein
MPVSYTEATSPTISLQARLKGVESESAASKAESQEKHAELEVPYFYFESSLKMAQARLLAVEAKAKANRMAFEVGISQFDFFQCTVLYHALMISRPVLPSFLPSILLSSKKLKFNKLGMRLGVLFSGLNDHCVL